MCVSALQGIKQKDSSQNLNFLEILLFDLSWCVGENKGCGGKFHWETFVLIIIEDKYMSQVSLILIMSISIKIMYFTIWWHLMN